MPVVAYHGHPSRDTLVAMPERIVATDTLSKCTTVQYKAQTREHIEALASDNNGLGDDIVMNVGDQWSDLEGGFAQHAPERDEQSAAVPVQVASRTAQRRNGGTTHSRKAVVITVRAELSGVPNRPVLNGSSEALRRAGKATSACEMLMRAPPRAAPRVGYRHSWRPTPKG